MNIKSQVVSLDLAKHLKGLGVKQESYFWWSAWSDHAAQEHVDCHELHWQVTDNNGGSISPRISAFTVAELGEMLPLSIKFFGGTDSDGRKVFFAKMIGKEVFASTEADARAKMLIYLLENKLITL